MIVREWKDDFVMIEQDNHAHISGDLMRAWKDSFFAGESFRESVEHAIFHHDYGWKTLDKQPFWNDEKQMPYTFIDFPNKPKTVFYKHGIDVVEKDDPYAALLCSYHYSRFLLNDASLEASDFIQTEEQRRKRIIHSLPSFDPRLFDFHYGLLQLCDNLSLYICLNEPGVTKDAEHPFYRDGISLSKSLHISQKDKLDIQWTDTETVAVSDCPFSTPLTVTVKQKRISKKAIEATGLNDSYQKAAYEDIYIRFVQNNHSIRVRWH